MFKRSLGTASGEMSRLRALSNAGAEESRACAQFSDSGSADGSCDF